MPELALARDLDVINLCDRALPHLIRFSVTSRWWEKWTAYRFTKNIYDIWMPAHFKKISSAIDQLPSKLDFEVQSIPETGLSQDLESHHLSQADASAAVPVEQQGFTPQSSFTGPEVAKRRNSQAK